MGLDFHPYTRFVSKSTYYLAQRVTARDCRLLYILSGTGSFVTNEVTYELSANTLIYYPCGMPYRISSDGELLFITVNFDFSEKYKGLGVMIPEASELFRHEEMLDTVPETAGDVFHKSMCFHGAVSEGEIINRMHDEYTTKSIGHSEITDSYLKILLTKLYRKYITPDTKNPLIHLIKETVGKDLTLNIGKIAEKLNYHPFYLNEAFRKSEGCSLHEYISKQRLRRATELITTTHKSLYEIALLCGFSSHSHMTTAFKKEYSITPVSLRKQI
ncbi:MAG: helix-turn-helix domain-containing protein [Ruminococcaceae bacterium]|nr:helix-turn-helix domain-containing protein [Oscillospiraceae bacterium]